MKVLPVGALLVAVVIGAGCQGRESEQARAFLAAYAAIDHNDPEPVRVARIEALEKLVVTSPSVAQTRDECTRAHRALLDSEGAQERAAQALDDAIRGDAGAQPLPPEQTQAIQAVISAAEAALSEARKRFARCEAEARDLSLRYGKR